MAKGSVAGYDSMGSEDSSLDFVQEQTTKIGLWYSYYTRPIATGRIMRAFTYVSQWDSVTKNARFNKPCLEFNQMQPIARAVLSEFREADPQWEVMPANMATPQKTVTITEGIMKKIAYDSNSKLIFQTAFKDAIDCGYGAYGIGLEYESPTSFNQVLKLFAVPDVFTCYWDPGARHPNKTDGDFCGIQRTISKQEFKRRWPKADVAAASPFSFQGLQAQIYYSDDDLAFYVDHFYKEYYTEMVYLLEDGKSMTKKEFEEHEKLLKRKRRRLNKMRDTLDPKDYDEVYEMTEIPDIIKKEKRTCFRIKRCFMTHSEVLEETDFPCVNRNDGIDLPLIYWEGNSVLLDGKQVPIPLLQSSLDAQRLLNYVGSTMADGVLTSRKEQYMVTPQMIAGRENFWQNTGNVQGFLLYNETSDGRAPIPVQAPPFNPALSGFFNQTSEMLTSITGRYGDSSGAQSNAISQVAVMQRQMQGNLTIGIYPDNGMDAISVGGRLIAKLIPLVYDTEREVTTMSRNGQSKSVVVNKKMPVYYEKDGEMRNHVENDLSEARFDIRVNAGSSFAAQKQLNFQQMTELMSQSQNPLFSVIGDELAANLNLPNTPQITQRIRDFVINPQIIAKEEHKKPPPPPPPSIQQKIEMMDAAANILEIKERIKSLDTDKLKDIMGLIQQHMKTEATKASSIAEVLTAVSQDNAAQIESTARIADSMMKTQRTKEREERDLMADVLKDLSGA